MMEDKNGLYTDDDDNKYWYADGELHREGGPAIEYSHGDKYWYHHGKKHRVDGPAIECSNGHKIWFYNDVKLNCSSQEEFERLIKLKAFW